MAKAKKIKPTMKPTIIPRSNGKYIPDIPRLADRLELEKKIRDQTLERLACYRQFADRGVFAWPEDIYLRGESLWSYRDRPIDYNLVETVVLALIRERLTGCGRWFYLEGSKEGYGFYVRPGDPILNMERKHPFEMLEPGKPYTPKDALDAEYEWMQTMKENNDAVSR